LIEECENLASGALAMSAVTIRRLRGITNANGVDNGTVFAVRLCEVFAESRGYHPRSMSLIPQHVCH